MRKTKAAVLTEDVDLGHSAESEQDTTDQVEPPEPKKKKRQPPATIIENCQFTAVEWDRATLQTVDKVADTLKVVAEASLKLATLFASQQVKFNTMLQVGQGTGPSIISKSSFIGRQSDE